MNSPTMPVIKSIITDVIINEEGVFKCLISLKHFFFFLSIGQKHSFYIVKIYRYNK